MLVYSCKGLGIRERRVFCTDVSKIRIFYDKREKHDATETVSINNSFKSQVCFPWLEPGNRFIANTILTQTNIEENCIIKFHYKLGTRQKNLDLLFSSAGFEWPFRVCPSDPRRTLKLPNSRSDVFCWRVLSCCFAFQDWPNLFC